LGRVRCRGTTGQWLAEEAAEELLHLLVDRQALDLAGTTLSIVRMFTTDGPPAPPAR
jgi:hypothetical protein